MKNIRHLFPGLLIALALASCDGQKISLNTPDGEAEGLFSLSDVAKILSDLPLESEHLAEVHDAVSSSSGHGYDEEYLLSDLFAAPGAGVGDEGSPTKAGGYTTPLRDLFSEYFARKYGTKAGASDVERYINALSESDMQIYWPYSEGWDGKSFPIVTFDPGFGAESNYGYEIRLDASGAHVVDSVLVTEQVAMERPVWVINRNDDAAFTPLELFAQDTKAGKKEDKDPGSKEYILSILSIKALRNYDSWFGGASELFVKTGAVDGFKATKDEDLKNYSPSMTDFMLVVKRSQVGKKIPFNAILLTSFTDQMEKIAFMVIEDDGGTTTSWKCSAVVKYNSKQYGFELEIPYKDKDDVVWRGQLTRNFFQEVFDKGGGTLTGRFGDIEITFALE
ncbi:MAG: hypothetical protein IJV37_06005 [Bacteroidales bacterium]|nr:hypothetical protein [Bacteroidales bacterium]